MTTNNIKILSYEVTDEALRIDIDYHGLPNGIKNKIQLIRDLLYYDSEKTIPIIKKILRDYPHIKMLSNFLYTAYKSNKYDEKAEQIAIENYKKFPNYIFAIINYGNELLEQKNIDKFLEINKNASDIQELFPNRKIFQSSEYFAYSQMMCKYFLHSNNIGALLTLLENMRKVNDEHPIVIEIEKLLKLAKSL